MAGSANGANVAAVQMAGGENAMSARPALRIGPARYAAWRATTLGGVTEALEQQLILGLAGELPGRKVLDAGSGDGTLVSALAGRGAQVTGVDADPAMLPVARARAGASGASFLQGRVERLPLPDASFDVVVAVTVLCFVPDPAGALRELARVLRPGGRLVVGELGRWSAWAAIRRVKGWRGSPTWRAAHFRTASELRALAEQADISVETVRGAVYYPPLGLAARAFAPLDARLARITTLGAAFLAVAGTREPGANAE